MQRLKEFADERITVNIGYQGGTMYDENISWSRELGIWFYFDEISESRYWNAFGIEKPSENSSVSIRCEINFPLSGINRSIGGAFVKDNAGNIFIVHRGRISRVRKSLFKDRYQGKWRPIDDGGIKKRVALECTRFSLFYQASS